MAKSPLEHVEILPNAHNILIGELRSTFVNGNYISNDQASMWILWAMAVLL
ncbi:hypothetical protein H1R20_g8998, partial [Candolleomyces eurysporus]